VHGEEESPCELNEKPLEVENEVEYLKDPYED